jgi:regulatory protein
MAARPPLSLKARAMQWLAQREHSRVELRRKLLRAARQRNEAGADARGAGAAALEPDPDADAPDPSAEVDALLDWLVVNKHLSEARFIESRVHARAARFGQRRIAHELKQHGAALDADSAARLRATELERARAVWARKFGAAPAADAAGRAKQMRFLAGRGFAADVIRRVVQGSSADD